MGVQLYSMNFDAIIIGAGISGLVAAHRLKKMGRNALLVEASGRVGGVIQSENVEGFLLEQGPNSLRGTHELLDLVEELELTGELITADPRAPAYVYFGGQLHAVPMSPIALIKTALISNPAKLRLLREPFIKRRPESGNENSDENHEESIASFVRRRLGPEILERMVAPFLSGVYAGNPEALSLQACFPRLAQFEAESGSVLRGGISAALASRRANAQDSEKPKRSLRPYRLCSFRDGLNQLPQTLAASLGASLMTETRVTRIGRTHEPKGYFEIAIERDGKQEVKTTAAIIIAATSAAAARLLDQCAPDLASLIAEIRYAGIASVPLAYRADQVARALDGFGFLAPRSAGLRTLGSIWNSSLFAERAPGGWVLTTNFIGGATDPEALNLSDEELQRIVHQDLNQALGVTGAPRILPITRYQQAIPQYNLGHGARVAQIETRLKNHLGLSLIGNYLGGVSLGDCIRNAEKAAVNVNLELSDL